MIKIRLTGEAATRRVWLNDIELSPKRGLMVRNHSPDGFNWGYGGSGPAQLALSICLELFDDAYAPLNYQDLKFDHIAGLPMGKDFDVELNIEI